MLKSRFLNPLSEEDIRDAVEVCTKNVFHDFDWIDMKVEMALLESLEKYNEVCLDTFNSKRIVKALFTKQELENDYKKEELLLLFLTVHVYTLMIRPEFESIQFQSVEDLVAEYPDFSSEDPSEQEFLRRFRNAMKVALEIIPGSNSKKLLLGISARLEGKKPEYVTGGGATKEVKKRILIYEKESGVTARARKERTKFTPSERYEEGSPKRHVSSLTNLSSNAADVLLLLGKTNGKKSKVLAQLERRDKTKLKKAEVSDEDGDDGEEDDADEEEEAEEPSSKKTTGKRKAVIRLNSHAGSMMPKLSKHEAAEEKKSELKFDLKKVRLTSNGEDEKEVDWFDTDLVNLNENIGTEKRQRKATRK